VRARLLLIFAGMCFGTTGTAQALGPDSASSLTIGAVRIAIGATLLLLASVGRDRGTLPTGMASRWWIAGAGMAAYQLTFFAGVRVTGVALGTVIALGSAPALTGIFGWLLAGEKPSRLWGSATGMAVVGVALLAGGSAEVHIGGVLLALGAGASYAAFAVASKELLSAGVSVEYAMARIFGLGAVLLIPILIVGDLSWVLTFSGLQMAFWLGMVPTAIAYLAYASGLRSVRAHEASTLILAEPITATLLGAIVLGERPAFIAWVGAGIIFAGLVLLARDRDEKDDQVVPA
jgi:DME family drug/metabolite transporter